MKSNRLPAICSSMLLCAIVACAPTGDNGPAPEPEAQGQLDTQPAEHLGAGIPAADFGHAKSIAPPEPEPEGIAGCQQPRPGALADSAAQPRAPGVQDPRYRVVEDQQQASRDAATAPSSHEIGPPPVAPEVLAAQARYLAELAGSDVDDPLTAEARADRKSEIMGSL